MPMFQGRTFLEWYHTPIDEDIPLRVENRAIWLYDEARGPVVQSDYGFNYGPYFEALGRLLGRGITLYAVFDHLQWLGPAEQRVMRPFMEKYPEPWRAQTCCVGTSQMGAGFIAHSKCRVINACIDGYDVPDGDFETLEEAAAAGYPIVEVGSLNMTNKAAEQVNDAIFIPSKTAAAALVGQIMADRAFILSRQQRFQPYPR